MKGERREDGELVGGVDALDVVRGVGFGVAETLRLGERLGEASRPPLDMEVRMKLVVPLMIAVTERMSLARRSRFSGAMIGMPPPTRRFVQEVDVVRAREA